MLLAAAPEPNERRSSSIPAWTAGARKAIRCGDDPGVTSRHHAGLGRGRDQRIRGTLHRMLIVLSGLPATGKSTLGAALARRLSLPLFSVDPIEAGMLRAGLSQGFETGLAAYLVAQALVDSQLSLGQGAIVDAVNAEEAGKDTWRHVARHHATPLCVVECACPDEHVHRARLESRQRAVASVLREPTWDDVQRRRRTYTTWVEPHLRVDTLEPIDELVAQVLSWLQENAAGAPSH